MRTVDDLVGVSRRNKPTKGIMDNVPSVAAMAIFVRGEQSAGGGSRPRGYTGCVPGRSIRCGDRSPGIMRRWQARIHRSADFFLPAARNVGAETVE